MVESRPNLIDYEGFAKKSEGVPVPTLTCDLDAVNKKVAIEVDMEKLIENLKIMGLSDHQIGNLTINLVNEDSIDGDYGAYDDERTIEIALNSENGLERKNEAIMDTLAHEVSHYRNKKKDYFKDFLRNRNLPSRVGFGTMLTTMVFNATFEPDIPLEYGVLGGLGAYTLLNNRKIRKKMKKKFNPEKTAEADEAKFKSLDPSIWLVKRNK